MVVNMVGFLLHNNWIFYLSFLLIGLALLVGGIKALIDPLNFDWNRDYLISVVPNNPTGRKWFLGFIRFFGIVILSIGLFLIIAVLTGQFA